MHFAQFSHVLLHMLLYISFCYKLARVSALNQHFHFHNRRVTVGMVFSSALLHGEARSQVENGANDFSAVEASQFERPLATINGSLHQRHVPFSC